MSLVVAGALWMVQFELVNSIIHVHPFCAYGKAFFGRWGGWGACVFFLYSRPRACQVNYTELLF